MYLVQKDDTFLWKLEFIVKTVQVVDTFLEYSLKLTCSQKQIQRPKGSQNQQRNI